MNDSFSQPSCQQSSAAGFQLTTYPSALGHQILEVCQTGRWIYVDQTDAQKKKVSMSNDNSASEVRTSQSEPKRGQRIFTYKASSLIWLALYVIEILIALRIMLDFMPANPESPIVIFVHGLTSVLLAPFTGLIAPTIIGGRVLEMSSIFAMGVYALAAVAIERLVWLIFYRPRRQAANVTETTTSEHQITP